MPWMGARLHAQWVAAPVKDDVRCGAHELGLVAHLTAHAAAGLSPLSSGRALRRLAPAGSFSFPDSTSAAFRIPARAHVREPRKDTHGGGCPSSLGSGHAPSACATSGQKNRRGY